MISAIVLVKNEEKNIVDCIENILFCDEIIIVDDYSTDKTKDLLNKLQKDHSKIKFIKRHLENNFSAQRQFGIEQAKNDWIFIVDADERVSKELATEIREAATVNSKYDGFLIKRIDFMWDRELKHGETGGIKLLRLFRRNKGEFKGKVHEVWVTNGYVKTLNNPLLHFPHQSMSEFLKEINFYSDLRAKELYEAGKKTGFLRIIIYSKGKFFLNYILRGGFLDGTAGMVHALMMSLHSFLVRGKLWLLWQKN